MADSLMMVPADLTYIDPGPLRRGDAFAHWIDVISSLALRYEEGAWDSYHPRTYWRGQSRAWQMAPGLHRRIRVRHQGELSNDSVAWLSSDLVAGARAIGLFPHMVPALGDMQLLAYLQHQGAATALLDFSSDFLTALAMICFDTSAYDEDGVLICYRYQPYNAAYVRAFTRATPETAFGGVSNNQVNLFHAPYLTARQHIQRGVFFFSNVIENNNNSTMAIVIENHTDSIESYYREHRVNGPLMSRTHPIESNKCAAIIVPKEHKEVMREWLRVQHQLDNNYVYPEALSLDIHRQYIQENSSGSPLGSNMGQKLF
ncbi:FRG domain-containing protein [Mycobacteroides chelonae]|uniref:FRG domain-containing protein n=1 Tax=Mycobacteroides chelonae TaxID=1774 RepID=UPI0009BD9282|nr:FRG domain-containing protein [Mycobacteroides chelonae]